VAQLGEVLGGMLTDVVQARMAADAVSAQALATYRADPVLSSLSVPRVTISALTVKLNFAVSGITTPDRKLPPLADAAEEWNTLVRDRVAPLIERAAPPARSRSRARAATPSAPASLRLDVPPEPLGDLAAGRVDPLVSATVERIVKLSSVDLPPEVQEQIASEVRREAVLFADTLRQRILAEPALHSRLEVDIGAEVVANTKPEALQSLEVTFSIEDIESFLSGESE
jgi:hypothetical protein